MQSTIKRSLFALPLAAGFALGSGVALAQATAPAATDKAKAEMVKPTGASNQAASGNRAATRDWSQVDTNKDGAISPDEMEAYLKANPGPLASAK